MAQAMLDQLHSMREDTIENEIKKTTVRQSPCGTENEIKKTTVTQSPCGTKSISQAMLIYCCQENCSFSILKKTSKGKWKMTMYMCDKCLILNETTRKVFHMCR